MAVIFDSDYISKIDVDKTVKNGRDIFEQYQPVVEKRIRQLMLTKMNSGSIICFSGDPKSGNSVEEKLVEKIAWNDDQIGNYIKNIYRIIKENKTIGEVLKLKSFYNLSDKEVAKKLNIGERTVRYNKSKAYYQLAVYSNQVEFVYDFVMQFKLD